MQRIMTLFCALYLYLLVAPTWAVTTVTPSHVYQASETLINEINALRQALGVRDYPPNPELQSDRSPIHVYAKSLEVLLKLIWIEQKYSISPSPLGQIPVKAVVPEDVLNNVNMLLEEVRRIKQALDIQTPVRTAKLETNKTPSDVYDKISLASTLLDGIVGRSLSFNDVYRNIQYVNDEMQLIANHLDIKLRTQTPNIKQRRRMAKDIAEQVYLAVHRMIDLQESLKMNASVVPNLTMVRITPSEVYDATTALMAELIRIKHHLKIEEPHRARTLPFGKHPDDVYANMKLINRNLDLMHNSLAQSWR